MTVKIRHRKLPSGKTQWYLDIYRNRERKTRTLGVYKFTNKDEKQEYMRVFEKARRDEELDQLSDIHGSPKSHRRDSSFLEYMGSITKTKKKDNTRKMWENSMMKLIEFGGETITFNTLTPQYLDRYKEYLLENLSSNSTRNYISCVKATLRKAQRENIIAHNPAANISVKTSQRLPSHLSLEELQKLYATPCGNADVKNAFLFACSTGLRLSDVFNLTWKNVKVDYIDYHQQKTDTDERFPISAQALRILEEQKTTTVNQKITREFPPNIVFRLPRQQLVNYHLKRWGKRAGIEQRMNFHLSRHTFATLALSAGVDIYTVSKLLTHKNLATTQIYARVVDEAKKNATTKMPNFDNSGDEV